jgi:WD40 repeat protein
LVGGFADAEDPAFDAAQRSPCRDFGQWAVHVVEAEKDGSNAGRIQLHQQIVDFNSGESILDLPDNVSRVVWLEDDLLVKPGNGPAVFYRSAANWSRLEIQGQTRQIVSLARRQNQLAIGEDDGAVRIYDLETGELQHELYADTGTAATHIRWYPAGDRLIAAGENFTLMMGEIGAPTLHAILTVSSTVHTLEISPDASLILVSTDTGFGVIHSEGDRADSAQWIVFTQAHAAPVGGIRWLGETDWYPRPRPLLLTWGGDQTARLWELDLAVGRVNEVLRMSDSDTIDFAAVHPEQAVILTAGRSGFVRLWSIGLETWLTEGAQRTTYRPLTATQKEIFLLY